MSPTGFQDADGETSGDPGGRGCTWIFEACRLLILTSALFTFLTGVRYVSIRSGSLEIRELCWQAGPVEFANGKDLSPNPDMTKK